MTTGQFGLYRMAVVQVLTAQAHFVTVYFFKFGRYTNFIPLCRVAEKLEDEDKGVLYSNSGARFIPFNGLSVG